MTQTTKLTDKWLVRAYVEQIIGKQYLTELYHVSHDDPQDIPFDDLPQRFVIKANNGSGWNIFISDKKTVDRKAIIKKCRYWRKKAYGYKKNERWYDKIKPKTLVEEYLMDAQGKIPEDYKLYVFHGRVKCIHIDTDRFTDHRRTLYDPLWNRLQVSVKYPCGPDVPKPSVLDEMIDIAEKLGQNFPFVRVDVYFVKGRIVFGELTFAPGSGREKFKPQEWDFTLGTYWS